MRGCEPAVRHGSWPYLAVALRIGIVGCGNIAPIYLQNLSRWPETTPVAVTDLDQAKAASFAAKFSVRAIPSLTELLQDPQVDAVLNLTTPLDHARVSKAALEAGKHVYSEKPLAATTGDARELVQLAGQKGFRLGCAPDTFLGAGLQTAIACLNAGEIGTPVACTAAMMCGGHEGWHPSPEFYYKPGGGPLFDMGPYYLTALVALLGPVGRVQASARASFPSRTSEQLKGQEIQVETPTHIGGSIDFCAGPIGALLMSFDVLHHNVPCLEIYGSEGSLAVPDPNCFGGPVKIRRRGDDDWLEVPLRVGHTENSRGLGLREMATAIQSGRPHRASGDIGLHVVEIMEAMLRSSETGAAQTIQSRPERPLPLAVGELP